MKTAHAIFAIALGAATLGGSVFAASPSDNRSAATSPSETWLTIPAIYDKVTAAGYRDIQEIERERDGYEVKGRTADGERVKLYVDPLSGEVLDARSKRDKSDKSDKSEEQNKSRFWSSDK